MFGAEVGYMYGGGVGGRPGGGVGRVLGGEVGRRLGVGVAGEVLAVPLESLSARCIAGSAVVVWSVSL